MVNHIFNQNYEMVRNIMKLWKIYVMTGNKSFLCFFYYILFFKYVCDNRELELKVYWIRVNLMSEASYNEKAFHDIWILKMNEIYFIIILYLVFKLNCISAWTIWGCFIQVKMFRILEQHKFIRWWWKTKWNFKYNKTRFNSK